MSSKATSISSSRRDRSSLASKKKKSSSLLFFKDDIYAPVSVYSNPLSSGDNARKNFSRRYKEDNLFEMIRDVSGVYTSTTSNLVASSLSSPPTLPASSSCFFAAGERQLQINRHITPQLIGRSLALLGSNNVASKTTDKNNQHNARKRKTSSSVSSSKKRKDIVQTLNKATLQRLETISNDALERVNKEWLTYFSKLREQQHQQLSYRKSSTTASDQMSNTHLDNSDNDVNALLRKGLLELKGAKVQILTCQQQPHLPGAVGYIVAETKQTWQIVLQKDVVATTASSSSKMPPKTKDHDGINSSTKSDDHVSRDPTSSKSPCSTTTSTSRKGHRCRNRKSPRRVVLVPKVGSTISILI